MTLTVLYRSRELIVAASGRLLDDVAAIHRRDVAGDERCRQGAQEDRRADELLREAEATGRVPGRKAS